MTGRTLKSLCDPTRHLPSHALVAAVLLLVIGMEAPAAAPDDAVVLPQPSAELQPGEVVEIVLDALANNDRPFPDAGIETTFNFASPLNKAYTGPLDRFSTLVKGPVFGQMVNHRESTLSEVIFEGDLAIRLVQIVSVNNETFYFAFRLRLQHEGDYAGMWLTEAVWPLKDPDNNKLSV